MSEEEKVAAREKLAMEMAAQQQQAGVEAQIAEMERSGGAHST